jgi:hypothetical protein
VLCACLFVFAFRSTINPRKGFNMPKSKALATVSAAAMSAAEINARFAALLATDPALAVALASQRVSAPYLRTDKGSKVSSQETESERVCRCAQFYSGNRSKLVVAFLAALGDKPTVTVTEAEMCERTGLPYYRVRPDAVTVSDRFSDTHNDKFPLVSQIGYSLRIEGERNIPRVYYFSRIVAEEKKRNRANVRKAKQIDNTSQPQPDTIEGE